MIERVLYYFEQQSFGVCAYLGEKFSISISKLRLFFIYATIIGAGFPILFYLFAGVILDFRNYVKKMRKFLWDN
ncbi:PspC domain-containing protein [Sphingobacterium sp. SYP-B4668]|uniref:PspC domain-containing protein n=1 Tax=Sphingobacterium sp. SYP-B4668 TaxID=2996035 RepID=UPI00053235A2|nr:PspC family transcriptional regulator [Sphingobacterium sp. SYP-B4668]